MAPAPVLPAKRRRPACSRGAECLAVRNALGVMDASTLGKIDACGPDVVEFLERIYPHSVAGMKAGRCAYSVILGEDGMLMDDGVMARLGEHRFYLTTTTGGAATVLDWLERWLQTEWPELEVYLTSLTEHYSTSWRPDPAAADCCRSWLRHSRWTGRAFRHDREAGRGWQG